MKLKKLLLPFAFIIMIIGIIIVKIRDSGANKFWAKQIVEKDIEKAKKDYDPERVKRLKANFQTEVKKEKKILENGDKAYIKEKFMRMFK